MNIEVGTSIAEKLKESLDNEFRTYRAGRMTCKVIKEDRKNQRITLECFITHDNDGDTSHIKKLETLEYEFMGDTEINGTQASKFFILANGMYNIYLHLVKRNTKFYQNTKRFKKILLENEDIRKAYVQLKQGLEKLSGGSSAYGFHKSIFINFVLENSADIITSISESIRASMTARCLSVLSWGESFKATLKISDQILTAIKRLYFLTKIAQTI